MGDKVGQAVIQHKAQFLEVRVVDHSDNLPRFQSLESFESACFFSVKGALVQIGIDLGEHYVCGCHPDPRSFKTKEEWGI